MKKSFLCLAFFTGFIVVNAQTTTKDLTPSQKETSSSSQKETSSSSIEIADATIDFVSKVVDYGLIESKSDGTRKFVFTNNGTEPLVIKNAKGSCGCTVPTWPKDPIAPGATSEIGVKYDYSICKITSS